MNNLPASPEFLLLFRNSQMPMLDYGCVVEVRPVLAMCPTMARVKEELAAAGV